MNDYISFLYKKKSGIKEIYKKLNKKRRTKKGKCLKMNIEKKYKKNMMK